MVDKKELKEYTNVYLGINKEPVIRENPLTAIIDLDNSDDFGRIYSKLNKKLKQMDDSTLVTETNSSILFHDEEHSELVITLKADYDGDTYQLVITSNE